MSKIEGGSFKNGFLSAAVSQAMLAQIDNINVTAQSWATSMSRGLAAGVVGGTVAAATGGNFENGMMTSAFAEIFNDELHSYEYSYPNAQALATAMGPDAIVFGARPLGNGNTMYDPGFTIEGTSMVLYPSDVKDGGFHEEIFWTDSNDNLHNVGFFKDGGLNYDTEDKNVSRYDFQSIQNVSNSLSKEMFNLPGFTEKTYNLLHNNCQVYAEAVRDRYGFNHY